MNDPMFPAHRVPLSVTPEIHGKGAAVQLTETITVVGEVVPRGTVGTVWFWWGANAACVSFPGVFGCPPVLRHRLAPAPEMGLVSGAAVICTDRQGATRVATVLHVFGMRGSAVVTVTHTDGMLGRYPRRAVRLAPTQTVAVAPAPASLKALGFTAPSTGGVSAEATGQPASVKLAESLTVYLRPATYESFAAACAARGLSMSAVAVTWLLRAAREAGQTVWAEEFPGAERLTGRRLIGRARYRRATTDRRSVEVYLYGREREHLDALAANEMRSGSNILGTLLSRGLVGAYPWPIVQVR